MRCNQFVLAPMRQNKAKFNDKSTPNKADGSEKNNKEKSELWDTVSHQVWRSTVPMNQIMDSR
jgi:hypothetical protein